MSSPTHSQVIVIGAGHAGCEAALAAARAGTSTLLLTINLDNVAAMSCNPSIGGQGKGHLVREIDALGGEMGLAADETKIQGRLLNTRKGLAVQAIRVQSDKSAYKRRLLACLLTCPNLHLVQAMVSELLVENGKIAGVRTTSGDVWRAEVIVLAPGTFLRGVIHIGSTQFPAGRSGEPPSEALGEFLSHMKFPLGRYKTGTPPRVDAQTIDFSGLEIQPDEPETPLFSLWSKPSKNPSREACYLTRTTSETHSVIRGNLGESALMAGRIHGIGPRYCPSIEDKVVRFAAKESHKVFLEPEGASPTEIYLQGLSTSLSESVQELFVHTLPGLENSRISRPGYAIEYDVVDPSNLRPTLESRHLPGLFLAGQINGTSGYEEAAAQGLIAGVNAAYRVLDRPGFILPAHLSYIGLMIEEITTQGLTEPYRIFTSRSPHRLSLRMSNAEERLSEYGFNLGLISDDRFKNVQNRKTRIEEVVARMEQLKISSDSLKNLISDSRGFEEPQKIAPFNPPSSTCTFGHFLRQPKTELSSLFKLIPELLEFDSLAQIEIEARIKYSGYLARQERELSFFCQQEQIEIPEEFFQRLPSSLSTEAKQKISAVRPSTLGLLSRIPGVRATDVALIQMHLRKAALKETKKHS